MRVYRQLSEVEPPAPLLRQNLLAQWQAACPPNEAQIRLRLLQQIDQGPALPPLDSLYPYLQAYLRHRHNPAPEEDSAYRQILQSYDRYIARSAAELQSRRRQYQPGEDLLLNLWQIESHPALLHRLVYGADYQVNLRHRLEMDQRHSFYYQGSLLFQGYQGDLARYQNPDFWLELGAGGYLNRRSVLGVQGSVGVPNQKQQLLAYSDSLQRGDLQAGFHLSAFYSNRLLEGRISDLRLMVQLGYAGLQTNLRREEFDEQRGENIERGVYFNGYRMGLALEWSFRIAPFHRLGLRTGFYLLDYTLGTTARDELAGTAFNVGLIYH